MDAPTLNVPVSPGDEPRRPQFTGRLAVGLMIVAVGVLFLLEALDVPGVADVWHYAGRLWPVVFIAIGLGKLASGDRRPGWLPAVIWIVVGSVLLANNFDLLSFSVWRLFWPAMIILFGFLMMRRGVVRVGYSRRRRRRYGLDDSHDVPPGATVGATAAPPDDSGIPGDPSPTTTAFAFMSGITRKLASQAFQSGDATAVMGGCEIDLRQSNIAGTAVFDAFAFMGGIELRVPADWTVKNEVFAILGGIDDSRVQTAGNPSKVLVLRGAAIMGGIEIKN